MLVGQLLPEICERLAVIHEKDTLMKAAQFLILEHIDAVVVCNSEEKMVGILTDSDILRSVATADRRKCLDGEFQCETSAASAMTRSIVSCHRDDILDHVWSRMKHSHLRHLPVVDEEHHAVGMLTARDALKYLRRESQHEKEYLIDYIAGIRD